MHFSSLISVLGLLYLLHHAQALPSHFDNSTDQESLLSFKSSVISYGYGVLDSWQQNSSVCLWHGVTCNMKKQRVTGVTLANYSIVGTLSSHITNLSFLQILNLEYNSFSGTIPVEIHRLFRLRVLNLNSNSIQGTIPPTLGGCSKLEFIDLSDNHLQGSIPSELGSLTELQDLNFAKNNISGVIPSSFGNLSSLTNLILLSNNIEGSIPPELGRLSNCRKLQIALNRISGAIPTELMNITSMIELVLAGNELSGNLPPNLFTAFPKISNILVGGNMLSGQLPASIPNISELEILDLSWNQFSGKVPMFSNLGKLQKLNIELNQFTSAGEDGFDFLKSLTNLTLLQLFSVSNNLLTGRLPSFIGNLSSQLFQLEMGSNKMSGNIPDEVANLKGLARLGLASNSFTGRIPFSIGKMKNLQLLTLEHNFLSGSIPETLGNLSNLFNLKLRNNSFNGGIPPGFSNCQALQNMDLSLNELTGNLPREILSIPNLANLNVSSNNLTGTLPSEIGNLEVIQKLDISNNHISGTIPSTLGDCSSLRYIDMSENSLEGPIPNSLNKLKGLEHLDISSNMLSGTIPPLDSLRYLQYLNLSYNNLQGEVPKTGIFLDSSIVFLTGNLDLCGGIDKLGLPKCSASERPSVPLRKNRKFIAALIAGGGAIVACITITLCFFLVFRVKKRKQPAQLEIDVISFEGPPRSYSYYELKCATGNFSATNLIGKGSFGSVYKGVMKDGTWAAIKVLDLNRHGAVKSFLAECEAFRNIRHRNLVKIISACSSPEFKALILQLMPNGSLEDWLQKKREEGLNLKQRIDIAIDVGTAMAYLHHECETPIVHCDLKPSNVLLDENMTAHVGDFGLARMLLTPSSTDDHQIQSSTVRLKGSIGYIAPEYGLGREVWTKGDVYSYGILVVEMFTETKATDDIFGKDLTLQKWLTIGIGTLPNILNTIFYDELNEAASSPQAIYHLMDLIKIGLECASESPQDRPEMKDVVVSINKIRSLIFN